MQRYFRFENLWLYIILGSSARKWWLAKSIISSTLPWISATNVGRFLKKALSNLFWCPICFDVLMAFWGQEHLSVIFILLARLGWNGGGLGRKRLQQGQVFLRLRNVFFLTARAPPCVFHVWQTSRADFKSGMDKEEKTLSRTYVTQQMEIEWLQQNLRHFRIWETKYLRWDSSWLSTLPRNLYHPLKIEAKIKIWSDFKIGIGIISIVV